MKTLKLASALFLCVVSANAFGQKTYYQPQEVPQKIKTYISTNFAGSDIVSAKKEVENGKTTYDVKLRNGTDFEFDSAMMVTEIETKEGLPKNVVPAKIWDYVAKNYPNHSILEWKKKAKHQKVELTQDVDLIFDLNGNFKKVDH